MKAVYIPNGPKNLAAIFPAINFGDISEYTVEVLTTDTSVLATSTLNRIDSCENDMVRIHFLNTLGAIDAMNFMQITEDHEPTSDSSQTVSTFPLSKPQHSLKRFNVQANDTITVTSIEYPEEQLQWVKELLDSPMAWIEWAGTQGQADSYLPIVIIDPKVQTFKQDDRFTYEVTLQFKFSNERILIRD